jgi:predicted Zn finger-like uncharacterized protein
MILTCPQCATRYQADDSKFLPAGRSVKCARCGKVWHQAPPPPEAESAVVLSEPRAASADAAAKSGPRDFKPREGAFAQYSVIAAEMGDESSSGAWAARAVRIAGWAALALIFASVGWASIHFREDVVALWPQSATLYKAVGLAVNPGGIDIVDVRNDLKVEDGARVLVVSGKLVNISGHELPVPQLRIALLDERERELFHWPVFAPAGTLMPGQSTRFLARLSDPPLAAAVQVTFARSEP